MANGVTKYVAAPSEISVVDRPCAPSATFSSVKSDGQIELRKFQTTMGQDDLLKQVKGELTYGLPEGFLLAKYNLTAGDLYPRRPQNSSTSPARSPLPMPEFGASLMLSPPMTALPSVENANGI